MTQRRILHVIVAAVLSAVIAAPPTVFAQTRIEYTHPPTGESLALTMADDGSSTGVSYTSPAGVLEVGRLTDGLLIGDFVLTAEEGAEESPTRDIKVTIGRPGETATAIISYDRETGEVIEATGVDPMLERLETFQTSADATLLKSLDAFWTQHAEAIMALIPAPSLPNPDPNWCPDVRVECALAIAAMLAASAAAALLCTPPWVFLPGGAARCLQALAVYATAVAIARAHCRQHPIH